MYYSVLLTFIVQEYDSDVRFWVVWGNQQGAIHLLVTSRLVHQHFPVLIRVLAKVAAFVQNGATFRNWVSFDNDPQWLTASVHFDSFDLPLLHPFARHLDTRAHKGQIDYMNIN